MSRLIDPMAEAARDILPPEYVIVFKSDLEAVLAAFEADLSYEFLQRLEQREMFFRLRDELEREFA